MGGRVRFGSVPLWAAFGTLVVLAAVGIFAVESQRASAASAEISGTVTEDGGGNLGGICVELFDSSSSPIDDVTTLSDGTYTFSGLSAGDYKVEFSRCAADDYQNEWYDDETDPTAATTVTVTGKDNTLGIDAVLTLGGSFNGTVSSFNTGAPIAGICVIAWDPSIPSFPLAGGGTDTEGNYTVTGLPLGDVKVSFSRCLTDPDYVSEWYWEQPDFASADTVTIAKGVKTTLNDVELTLAGSISGTVTDVTDDALLEGICVKAFPIAAGPSLGDAKTESDGTYTVFGLPAGDLKVEFRDCDTGAYLTEWYDDKPDSGSATTVPVVKGDKTPDIDAELTLGGFINGIVKDVTTDALLEGICVELFDSSGSLGEATTDSSGTYTFIGLTAGTDYKVEFTDCATGDYLSAVLDPVEVTEKLETIADIALTLGGSINGTVTDRDTTTPIEGIRVTVYDNSQSSLASAITDSDGKYTVVGLPAGTDHKVEFSDDNFPATYLTEWYDDQSDFGSAGDVPVVEKLKNPDPINAELNLGGSMNGTVTDDNTGGALPDICVELFAFDDPSLPIDDTTTNGDGDYSFIGLTGGSYKVKFQDCDTGAYLSEWYNDKPDFGSANTIIITEKQKTALIDAGLTLGGKINGTVTEAISGNPLEDICVDAYDVSDESTSLGSATTDINGAYSIAGLPTGGVKVKFSGCGPTAAYVTEWYNGQPDFAAAGTINVTVKNKESGIDAVLGLSINGTVTDRADSNIDLEFICVEAYDSDDSSSSLGVDGFTDSSGDYTITGLPSGDLKVEFSDCGTGESYLTQWYVDEPGFDSAGTVTVDKAAKATADAALSLGGEINGTVTDESVVPVSLEDICVEVYDSSGDAIADALTIANGTYSIDGLPNGEFKVKFGCDDIPRTSIYVTEWYDDQPDFDSGETVTITKKNKTPDIDAALTLGGSISGNVTDANTTDPIPGICVIVYDPFSPFDQNVFIAATGTDPSGNYTVSGLPNGALKVVFGRCREDPDYVSQWYDGQPDFDSAGTVFVTGKNDTSPIDAELTLGGEISGTVTRTIANGGDALAGICVEVFDSSGSFLGDAPPPGTDSSGAYTVFGLPAGIGFKVEFSDCGTGAYLTASISPITVTAKGSTPDVNAELTLGGEINGTVTDDTTADPIPDICVTLYDLSGNWLDQDQTDGSGAYTFSGLPTGGYKLDFNDCGTGDYLSEWYDGQPGFDSAGTVQVTEKEKTADIDAALTLGGSINGTVTSENGGAPLPDICVDVYDASDQFTSIGDAETNSGGTYSIGGLPNGDVKIEFFDCGTGAYLGEWYNDKADFDSAGTVTVDKENKTTGIDAALTRGGEINGTVTSANNIGVPLPDICVDVYDASDEFSLLGSDRTNRNGDYAVAGLPTGDYKVEFVDCGFGSYVGQWYDNETSFASADTVNVTEKNKATLVDAELTRGGSINGTVVDDNAGDPLEGICVEVFDSLGSFLGFDTTNINGDFRVVGMPAGDLDVEFRDCATGAYLTALVPAVTVPVKGEGIVQISLTLGGSINGTVTDRDTTNPIEGIRVTVYDSSQSLLGSATTDSLGEYTVVGLPTGDHKVEFRDDNIPATYLAEWNIDKPDFGSADEIPVTEKVKTSPIDAELSLGGSINGTVTDIISNDALPDICVELFDSLGSPSGSDTTDSSGGYTFIGLSAGDYNAQFSDCSGSGYIEQWYDGQPDLASADPVNVTEKVKTTAIDAALGLPGSITICKETSPTTADPFGFTGDLAVPTLTDGDCETFSDIVPGDYSVTEIAAAGWILAAVNCTGTPAGNIDVVSTTVTVDLKSDEDVVCTFVNAKPGSITICKNTDPASTGDSFDFDGTLGVFALTDAGDCEVSSDRVPGDYTVTEDVPADWNLTAIDCTGTPEANTPVDLGSATVTITLKPDTAVICTFTNTEAPTTSSITICKDTDPASTGASFDFDGTLGVFALTDAGPCKVSSDLVPGAYTVTETATAGWNLTEIVCAPDDNISVDLPAREVTITLKAGTDVSCTFTNTEAPTTTSSIEICKETSPTTAESFNFSGGLGDFDLTDAGPCKVSSDLVPGDYTVTETATTGWNLTAIDCSDTPAGSPDNIDVQLADRKVTVILKPDTDVKCTFTNTQKPLLGPSSITICKTTNPASTGVEFDFDGGLFGLGDIDLFHGDCSRLVRDPADYTVTENETAGWNLTNIACTGTPAGNIDVDLAAEEVTVTLKSGTDVTCTFTNTQKPVSPTSTRTPANTPTSTPTNTPTSGPTNTPTNTPTETNTPTVTNTPANTATNTPANTPTNTPTSGPANTPTNTPTPTSSDLTGDVDCGGTVIVTDATLILQFFARLVASLACLQNADVNGDTVVDPVDAVFILQYIAGLIESLGLTP